MTDATLLTDRARPAVRLERISPTHPRSSGRRSPSASSFGPGFSLAGLEPAHDAWQTKFERYAAAFEPSLGPQERLPAGYKGGERREET